MNMLSKITQGTTRHGLRVVFAAQEKMGKTTLSAGAPAPLLLPLEVGYSGVNVAKLPMLQTLEETTQAIDEISAAAQQGQFPYRTIILDSITALERQIHDYVLRQDPAWAKGNKRAVTMESALGGYGKAYTYANEVFESLLKKLDLLAVYGGINIVCTCHVFASKVMDPSSGEYDCWDLLLHSPKNQKTYGKREIITQWADIVGFMYDPIFVSKTDTMTKAVSQNKGRQLGVSRMPSYVAGNRYGMQGEIPIPQIQGWNNLASALHHATGGAIDVFTR